MAVDRYPVSVRGWRGPVAVLSSALMLSGLVTASSVGAATARPSQVASAADVPSAGVEVLRTVELDDVGVSAPVGFTASADGRQLYVVAEDDRSSVAVVGAAETFEGSVSLPVAAAADPTMALDPLAGELVVESDAGSLMEVPATPGPGSGEPGHSSARGSATGALAFSVDGVTHRLSGDRLVTSGPGSVGGEVNLSSLAEGQVEGLAVDGTGDVYVGDPAGSQVLVLDASGTLERTLDLGETEVEGFDSLAVAPSANTTDDPDTLSLYVLGESSEGGPGAELLELSTEPALAVAAAVATDSASVVQTVLGSSLSPQSPDSAGLTYMPNRNRLVLSDSEVNEYNYYSGTNLWTMTPAEPPSVTGRGNTLRWSQEPTGVAFDPASGRLYTSDDNNKRVYEINIGADGVPGTADDVVVRSFGTTAFGWLDPEGLTIDTTRGWMYGADGSNGEVWIIRPGPNGVFEGGNDDVISHFDVEVDGVRDPEGITYDGLHDTITVVDYRDTTAAEYDVNGQLRRQISLGASGLVHPAGVTWAPSSTGTGTSLWVADRGSDGSSPVDGKVVEFAVPALGGPPPPQEPDVSVAPASLDFGQVVVGGSADRDVVVSNLGSASLSVTSTTISGPNASRFSVVSGGGSFSLAAGETRTVRLRYSPIATGSHSASLTVASNDADEASVVVGLAGSAVSQPPPVDEITVTGSFQGGSSGANSVATSVPVPVSPARLYVAYVSTKSNVAVTGVSGLGGSWSPVEAQCGGRNQTGVAAFATTSATSSSVVTATMGSAPSNAALAVVEYAGVDLTSPFAATTSANTNGVNGGCSGGSDSSSYSVDLAVPAGAMVVGAVNGRHRNHTAGAGFVERVELSQGSGGSSSSLNIIDRLAASAGVVTVNGTLAGGADWSLLAAALRPDGGSTPPPPPDEPDVSVTPTSLGFGQVVVGGSADREVIVSNVGSSSLSVTSTSLSGPNAGRFSVVSGGGAFSLAPGASRTLVVRYSPTAEGSHAASLSVASNDPDEASVVVALSGSAVTEPPPAGEITVTETAQGGSSLAASVSTSAPVGFTPGSLYVAYVGTKGNVAVTGISGLGGSWFPVEAQCAGRNQTGVAAFATTSAASSTAVTASLAGSVSSAALAVVEYSGVDLSAPFGSTTSANTNGVDGACSGGTDSASYSVGLSVPAGSMVVGAVNARHRSHTAGAGFAERVEVVQDSGGSASSVNVVDRVATSTGVVTVSGTLGGTADWSLLALAVRPAAG
jgi:hypothetical protein